MTSFGNNGPSRRAAQPGATLRRNHAIARAGHYGTALGELLAAERASERARLRAVCNTARTGPRLAANNYRTSLAAVERDVAEMEVHLLAAADALMGLTWLSWGWRPAPLSWSTVSCRSCDGTGLLTACEQCDGFGSFVVDEQCADCGDGDYGRGRKGGGEAPGQATREQAGTDGNASARCPTCLGLGRTPSAEVQCPACGGRGHVEPFACAACAGFGIVGLRAQPRSHLLVVDLPPGQVTFACSVRGPGPAYPGRCTGPTGERAELLIEAIDQLAHLPKGIEVGPDFAFRVWAAAA